MHKIIENKLIENFKDKDSFSRKELFDFFKSYDTDLNEGTFGWRIFDLKKRNVLKSLKNGVYTLSVKQEYQSRISKEILKIAKKITELYDDVEYSIWETSSINEFSRHQSGINIIIIEIEKQVAESLFYELKDSLKYDFFINPNETTIELYVSESSNPAVIKKIITRAPIKVQIQNKVKISVPYLEKILVDLYCDDKLFYFSQGAELTYIYESALKKYHINYSILMNYAKRRGRQKELKQFFKTNLQHLIKNIFND